jgi:hypothetical protein
MSYYDPITKKTNQEIQKSYNDYIKNYEKNKYLQLWSNIGLKGSIVDPVSKSVNDKNAIIIKDYLQKNPQNFFYRMQGGCHNKEGKKMICYEVDSESSGSDEEEEYDEDMECMEGGKKEDIFNNLKNSMRYGGASKRPVGGRVYNKKMVGGASSYDYKYKDPLKAPTEGVLANIMKYIGQKITKPLLKKMLGGASTQSQLSAQQQAKLNETLTNMKRGTDIRKARAVNKMDVKEEQMLEQQLNPLDKKEKARREQLSKLTDKQKAAYLRSAAKKGVERYNKQTEEFSKKAEEDRRYRESRDWANIQKTDRQEALDEKARLEREAKDKAEYEASKSLFDKFGEEALGLIPEVAGLIPVKALQAPAKGLLKQGVSGLLGQGSKKKVGVKKVLSPKQKAYQAKIKMIMNKEKCNFKEALTKLKNYK